MGLSLLVKYTHNGGTYDKRRKHIITKQATQHSSITKVERAHMPNKQLRPITKQNGVAVSD